MNSAPLAQTQGSALREGRERPAQGVAVAEGSATSVARMRHTPRARAARGKAVDFLQLWFRVFQRVTLALFRHRVAVLLFLVVGLALGDYGLWRGIAGSETRTDGVLPVAVNVQVQQRGTNFVLVLREKVGNRRLAMSVEPAEALVIARAQGQRIQGEVTQAFDLTRNIVQELGGRVDRVVVNDADQSQYYAQVVVADGAGTRVVRARPSDAVALAVTMGTPVYVEDRVLEEYGARG